MSTLQKRLAAGATLVALGGLAAVAMASGGDPAGGTQTAAQPVEVRTEVVRPTVHRKPRRQAPPAARSSAPAAGGSGSPRAAPATPAVAAPSSVPARPVRTRTSPTGGEHEDEHAVEHEDREEHEDEDD